MERRRGDRDRPFDQRLHASRSTLARRRRKQRRRSFEQLENRLLLATDLISFSPDTRTVTIEGTSRDDTATVREISGERIEVSLRSSAVEEAARFEASTVRRIVFLGADGDDSFVNDSSIPSYAEGGEGDDTLVGGSGDDELHGGDGEDNLQGRDGEDELYGDRGLDQLYGGDHDDRLFGGDHDDELFGGSGNDLLDGGSDVDRLYGEGGADELYGRDGDDRLYGDDGDDLLYGGAGVDRIFGGRGNDQLFGSDGEDRLYGEGGDDRIDGGDGNDKLYGGAGNDQLFGGDGDDRIFGDDGRDRIDGGRGDDILYGHDDDDRIEGGKGLDKVFGGEGDDDISTGPGDDVVYGEAGDDLIDLEGDDDRAYGGDGDDLLLGGDGRDALRGDQGNDILVGGDDRDELRGHGGADLLIGGNQRDSLDGDDDDDILVGGATTYDADLDALRALRDAWTADAGYHRRIETLEDRAAAVYLLSGYTVRDDLEVDELYGAGGDDWYVWSGVLPGVGAYQYATGSAHGMTDGPTVVGTPPEVDTQAADLTAFDVIQNLDSFELEHDEQFQTLIPHPTNRTMRDTHASLLTLVDVRSVTHVAVRDGDWSASSTWRDGRVPGDGARVQIPAGQTVTVDRRLSAAFKTVRVDGELRFATRTNTELRVDTLVVTPPGRLEIGRKEDPIASNVTARILIADDGPIDRAWDPSALSRGVIVHGSLEIFGEEKTAFVPLARAPGAGDNVLRLDRAVENWHVGDELVIAGTEFDRRDHEVRTILAIDDSHTRVTIAPLEYDHITPRDELQVHVANLTRNVVVTSENSDFERRGHTMFMHTDRVDIRNVAFERMGRTDKLSELNDPVLNRDGRLVAGTGTNARGRYPVHFHRGGVVDDGNPAIVRDLVVQDSPGWGLVIHSSFVDVRDSITFDTDGAGFVTEAGDEIGSIRKSIAIYSKGSGEGITDRSNKQDFAHQGVGFWLQGSGMFIEGNVSAGHAAQGYLFYSRGLEETDLGTEPPFPSINLDVPAVAEGRTSVPVSDVPITTFNANIAYDSIEGVNIRYHLEKAEHDTYGKIRDLTLWNNETGMNVYYSRNLEVKGLTIVTSVDSFDGTALDHNDASENLIYRDVFIEGYFVGIDLPRGGDNVVEGGYFRNANNIAIVSAEREREILIRNVTFDQLAGYNFHTHIWTITRFGRDDLWALTPDRITLDYGRFTNARLFFEEQHPDYVPFPREDDDVPREYVGKSNRQLWNEFRIAVGGALATDDDARDSDLIDGLLDD